jgi:hypothetical protein
MAQDRIAENRPLDDKPVGRARDKSTGPARPPFEHPNKMDVKTSDAQPSGKRASGSDKSKEPKQGGDAARKAQEWGGGSKGSKGPAE